MTQMPTKEIEAEAVPVAEEPQELFDSTVSRLAESWAVAADTVDISARVEAAITSKTSPQPRSAKTIVELVEREAELRTSQEWRASRSKKANAGVPTVALPERKANTAKTLFNHIVGMSATKVDVSITHPTADALAMLSAEVAFAHFALPMNKNGRKLYVAFADPVDTALVDAISYATDCDVQPLKADRGELAVAIAYAKPQPNVDAEEQAMSYESGSSNQSGGDEFAAYFSTRHSATPLPLLTVEQEQRLVRDIKRGHIWARKVLFRAHLYLVNSVTKKYASRGLSVEHSAQVATSALDESVETFDRRESRFSTYAMSRIIQALNRAVEAAEREGANGVGTIVSRDMDNAFPFVDLDKNTPERDAIETLTSEEAHAYHALPVKKEARKLWVAMRDPKDVGATDAIRMATGCLVQAMYAKPELLDAAILATYGRGLMPPPPTPPTAVGAPAPEPGPNDNGESAHLLRDIIGELRGLHSEIAALRAEVAQMRRERAANVPHPSIERRLFPSTPAENAARRDA